MAWLDSFFPKENLKRAYIGTMNELGIKVEKQANIKIDDELRPQKTARASCFRIHPPDDIRLLVSPIGGAYDYRTFFHEAGHAQHFSWVSPTLFERYPEFIYPPENATTESFAFLFQNLFNDPIWLSEHLPNLREEQARKIARELSLITLFSVRRAWAKLRYEIELHGYTDIRSEKLSASYSSLQTEATGFERDGTLYVWDVDDGFYCTAYLRAWAFEAGFREHLKTRHGRRWWRERKAADALVDIWNVGCRYSVEELAKQIGFNEISFDFLADDLIKAIREE
jgi:oligoendopeptidase F